MDCEHEEADVRTVFIRLGGRIEPIVQWCTQCGAFDARDLAERDRWHGWELPAVAMTSHFAIATNEALCGNLFGRHTRIPRAVDCNDCKKRAAQYLGVMALELIGGSIGLKVLRRLRG